MPFTMEAIAMEQMLLPRQYINGYHLDASLLFQFILAETLAAYSQMDAIAQAVPLKTKERIQIVAKALQALAGSHRDYMRLFAWNPNEGILTKLKSYCTFFAERSALDDKKCLALHRLVNEAWLQCLHCLDTLRFYNEHPPKNNQRLEDLHTALSKFTQEFQRLGKIVVQKIEEFRDDENVLFFLLRHRSQFDTVFGKSFVKNYFTKNFPKGMGDAVRFISQKFSKRGFQHLLSLIASKVGELESSAL